MRALITGINGFVGGHLSKLLLANKYEVYGVGLEENGVGNTPYFQGDLLDLEKIKEIVVKTRPELIFHLAGFTSVRKSFEEPELCRKINVEGTKNLLEAVINSNLNPKILIVSSAEVYGNARIKVVESSELKPLSPYAKSKKEQEEVCRSYLDKLNIIILRSCQHLGPGQKSFFAIPSFTKQIAEIEKYGKEKIIKTGNLEVIRDFTDVRDISEAYFLASEKCIPGEVYNICSENIYSINEILGTLISLAKIEIKTEQDPKRIRSTDNPILQADCSKFRNQTGWAPKIPLKKTLEDLLNYWRAKV